MQNSKTSKKIHHATNQEAILRLRKLLHDEICRVKKLQFNNDLKRIEDGIQKDSKPLFQVIKRLENKPFTQSLIQSPLWDENTKTREMGNVVEGQPPNQPLCETY